MKMQKAFFTAFLATLIITSAVFAGGKDGAYPLGPDGSKTPGSLCTTPTERRYPEQIAYCERNVETSLKNQIIQEYNSELGYEIRKEERSKYKIDHYIPLCMGGSNQKDNLWPQHEVVYTQTDMIEQVGCQKMAEGKLQQRAAIEFVREAKLDLSKAKSVLEKIKAL